jgi:hypothetical protein
MDSNPDAWALPCSVKKEIIWVRVFPNILKAPCDTKKASAENRKAG